MKMTIGIGVVVVFWGYINESHRSTGEKDKDAAHCAFIAAEGLAYLQCGDMGIAEHALQDVESDFVQAVIMHDNGLAVLSFDGSSLEPAPIGSCLHTSLL